MKHCEHCGAKVCPHCGSAACYQEAACDKARLAALEAEVKRLKEQQAWPRITITPPPIPYPYPVPADPYPPSRRIIWSISETDKLGSIPMFARLTE